MNKLFFIKLDTIETNLLLRNINLYYYLDDKENHGYSLELDEYINDKIYLSKMFKDSYENLQKIKETIIKNVKLNLNNKNVLNKVINIENYIGVKNSLYMIREPLDYSNRLLKAYDYNFKNKCNWKYDLIYDFIKERYNTRNVRVAFYKSAVEEFEKIKNKCFQENIQLIVLKSNESPLDYANLFK